MASVTTATSEWIQFFKDAGIPPSLAVNYALSFVDNRIQKNMLMDLSKEIMMDLGITVIGDIIAILKHAKQVHRQDMCKMATEAITSGQTSVQAELRRTANTPATRMIANALSRDSPPSTPVRRPDNRLSVTVSNKQAGKSTKAVLSRPADEGGAVPVKRRRVTAEMEDKGMKRTSVFERLGAESKADTTTGSKPTGVFSRLGRGDEEEDEEVGAGNRGARRPGDEEEEDVGEQEDEEEESDGEGSVLQYAGVLKRPLPSLKRAAASSSQPPPKPPAKPAPTTLRRLGNKAKPPPSPSPPSNSSSSPEQPPPSKLSILQRLGKLPPATPPGPAPQLQPDTQDSRVTSTRPKALASSKVSSSTGGGDCGGAQMDNAGTVSVFKRLGTKKT
ncbi:uncharacterized protein C19orf47 homolog isoform X2 [Anguilla anguilla]|uniref:uncharacterized protein C19orf47 homolog isoform X2 n=1 Tax=Anguilla anguilla TaxID=7936 RepID=UPI0015A8891D|nr:uncharacterized protein C19orf47 homolog isoform X2 [Anguilla anguilla]